MGFNPFTPTIIDPTEFSGLKARVTLDAVTNGTTTVTSATASYTAGDLGKVVVLTGANDSDIINGNSFASTIVAVPNSTTITLAAAPSWSESSVSQVIGYDNGALLSAFFAGVAGGQGHIPAGIYVSTVAPLTIQGSTLITGDGYDLGPIKVSLPPQYGSVLVCAAAGNPTNFIRLGATSNTFGPGLNSAQMQGMAIDGSGLCQTAVTMNANRSVLINNQIQRGLNHAIQINGQGMWLYQNFFGQQNSGDVLYLSGSDAHIEGNQFRQQGGAGAGIRIVNTSDPIIVGNHISGGYNNEVFSSFPANNIIIEQNTSAALMFGFVITGNLFDGVYGHNIVITAQGGGNCQIADVNITGNYVLADSGFPNDTFDVVYLDAEAGGIIQGVTMEGNTIRGVSPAGNIWRYLINSSAAGGTIGQIACANNVGIGVANMWPGGATLRPDGGRIGNSVAATMSTTTSSLSSNDGQATFSGTGAQTAFTISHGLSAAPVTVTVTPASAGAAALFSVTVSATQITVTFNAAPALGANNVILNWWASL